MGPEPYAITTYRPHPALARYVECYRVLSATEAYAPVVTRLPLWPFGTTELCLVVDGTFRLTDRRSATEGAAGSAFLVGPKTRVDWGAFGADVRLLNVSFAPGGAAALLGVDAAEVADRYLPVDLLDAATPPVTRVLDYGAEGRLGDALAAADRLLLDRLDRETLAGAGRLPPGDLEHARSLIETTHGRMPVAAVARELGRSPRHLERLFGAWIGLPPKAYARLARLQHAKALLVAAAARPTGGRLDLGLLAHHCGFHDQAHMTNEFARTVGLSPGRVAALAYPDGLVGFLQDTPHHRP